MDKAGSLRVGGVGTRVPKGGDWHGSIASTVRERRAPWPQIPTNLSLLRCFRCPDDSPRHSFAVPLRFVLSSTTYLQPTILHRRRRRESRRGAADGRVGGSDLVGVVDLWSAQRTHPRPPRRQKRCASTSLDSNNAPEEIPKSRRVKRRDVHIHTGHVCGCSAYIVCQKRKL